MSDSKIRLKIVTPNKIFFDDFVNILTIKTTDGFIGLMKNHIPFVSMIQPCTFDLEFKNSKSRVAISRGLIFTDGKVIQVISDDIIRISEKSLITAKQELKSLEDELKKSEKQSHQYMLIDNKIQEKIQKIKLME